MKKDVTVTLWSQREGEDPVTLTAKGTLESGKNGDQVLCYETPEGKSMVTARPGRVAVERLGDIRYRMVFEEGKRHTGRYETPYGTMEMAVVTHSLQGGLDSAGEVFIGYHIEFGGVAAERTRLRLTLR